MLQYLIILLDDTSVSYCHYDNISTKKKLIPLETLKLGIRFAMMENLNIQFIYPSYELPERWKKEIESIDHSKIKPMSIAFKTDGKDELCLDMADVAVISNWELPTDVVNIPLVIRTNKDSFFKHYSELVPLLQLAPRINVILTDEETFTDSDFDKYKKALADLSQEVENLYTQGKIVQLNLLTDRIILTEMNNCGAGDTNLTLAPNGKLYICPAFYYENAEDCVGDLEYGLNINNKQLYRLNHAPICRNCDAYQCKRCVWLNRMTTLEVNTPSHEQCVVAHMERNASRELLENIRKHGMFLPDREICELTYLDPFEEKEKWQH